MVEVETTKGKFYINPRVILAITPAHTSDGKILVGSSAVVVSGLGEIEVKGSPESIVEKINADRG